MGKARSKPKRVFKAISIVLLIGVSAVLWTYGGTQSLRLKSFLTFDGDSSDTIILVQERSRVRVLFDTVKKMSFIDWGTPDLHMDFQIVNYVELKSLFVNAYQRNVFYVYASFSVP